MITSTAPDESIIATARATIITAVNQEVSRIQCNVNKPKGLTAGFNIDSSDVNVTCSESDEGVSICIKDGLTDFLTRSESEVVSEVLPEDMTTEEIEEGALERESNFEVDHVASFVLQLQPEFWLPLQDDEEAFQDLTDEICGLVDAFLYPRYQETIF